MSAVDELVGGTDGPTTGRATATARPPLVRRVDHVLRPDPSRVLSLDFLPGDELDRRGVTRTAAVVGRVLALGEDEVTTALADTLAAFGPRHRDLAALLDARFELVARRVQVPAGLSPERRLLIGACLSQEYAIEAAAVFNPSIVPHPDQSGLEPGSTRFVMSVRGVGEGHVSCIEFRTGTVDAHGDVRFDVPGPASAPSRAVATEHSRTVLQRYNLGLVGDGSAAAQVLETMPDTFSTAELLAGEPTDLGTATVDRLALIASLDYTIEYAPDAPLGSRVILPGGPAERRGLEDLRLIRFDAPDGTTGYLGTYTAFDGNDIATHLLRTEDFTTLRMSRLTGQAAANKGLALFPRTVHGQYLALSRWDRENNTLARSDDLLDWQEARTLGTELHAWEIVQSGNCGGPIETAEGWLVLTHGVGPMRQYSIGAMLLDLDDPRVVLAHLAQPLLTPHADDQTATCPTSSTPAGPCCTATPWCSRTAPTTPRSGSRSSTCRGCSHCCSGGRSGIGR
ncbi:glycoside hydrolase family 130 protein [Cellulomonas hominis]